MHMLAFIINQFENRQKQKKQNLRNAFGIFAGKIGLLSNLLLFVSKLLIGLISGSVSIMADAMNSLSDTLSSVLTLVGFHIAGKPADKEHPYGHERFEYISGMMVSLLITFVGFQFLMTSIDRIKDPKSITVAPIVLVILVLSILVKVWQGLFYQAIAQKITSNTLVAASKDSLNDVFTTLAVLISAGVEGITGLQIDGYVGLLIAIYIIYSGIQLIREFINELMGVRPNQEEIDHMKEYLSDIVGIIGYHDLLIHQYGPNKKFASVHIEIDDRWDLNQSHEKIDEIELKFKEQLGVDLVCHIDPVNLHDQIQQFVYQQLKSILKGISSDLKAHDIRTSGLEGEKQLLFDLVIPLDFKLSDYELRVEIQRQVFEKIGDYKIIVTFDHNYLL